MFNLYQDQSSFQNFISSTETNYAPEIVCLITQAVLSLHTALNLKINWNNFPVKQLSPILSLIALLCFFLLNCISLTAKIIETDNQYYNPNPTYPNCGQCRLYQHKQLIILSFFYQGLRQLPFLIFIVKTLRVCICYWIDFQTQIFPKVVAFFKSQLYMLIACILAVLLLIYGQIILFDGGSPTNGMIIFQFLCPKQSSPFDWCVSFLRFMLMAFVYVVSISTYDQLDFKRFLLMIFVLNNTEVILRISLAFSNINGTTYH